jgi:hypothetical protein
MASILKPAPPKAWALLEKLQALAARGIDGEKLSAQNKIARLKARYDFTAPNRAETPNLFSGTFQPARKAKPIYKFETRESDVANSVKWAIESTTKMRCIYRDGELLIEAAPASLKRLKEVANYIARCFRKLLAQLGAVEGINESDRTAFVMGLYDGMMNETRDVGQRLPNRPQSARRQTGKPKQPGPARSATLHVHPYTLAVSLGKQIRFSTPVEQIAHELEAMLQKNLSSGEARADS